MDAPRLGERQGTLVVQGNVPPVYAAAVALDEQECLLNPAGTLHALACFRGNHLPDGGLVLLVLQRQLRPVIAWLVQAGLGSETRRAEPDALPVLVVIHARLPL